VAAKIDDAARWIVKEHVRKKAFTSLPMTFEIVELSEAYQVQEKVIPLFKDHRGEVGGYKLAMTSKPIQQLCGIDHPCAGHLFKSEIYFGNRTIELDNFGRLGIEFELAVRIGRDLPSAEGPWDRQKILPHIEEVFPAFELVDDRHADYQSLNILTVIADNACSGGVVLGTACHEWHQLDFDILSVVKDLNGDKENSNTGLALGNPLNSVVWLANFLNDKDCQILSGDILMTGSTFATYFAEKGDVIEYHIDQIGSVKIEIK
jgi:2-keto-4-pentenoate hydratase